MNTHTAMNYGMAALAAKVALGASLALGFGSMPLAAAAQGEAVNLKADRSASAADHGETVHLRQPVVQVSEIDYMSDGSIFATEQGEWHHEIKGSDDQWRDVTESDTEWSCVDDGNRTCGPQNAEGKPAACYDEGGVIVALWPCKSVVNADGSQDVDFDTDK